MTLNVQLIYILRIHLSFKSVVNISAVVFLDFQKICHWFYRLKNHSIRIFGGCLGISSNLSEISRGSMFEHLRIPRKNIKS